MRRRSSLQRKRRFVSLFTIFIMLSGFFSNIALASGKSNSNTFLNDQISNLSTQSLPGTLFGSNQISTNSLFALNSSVSVTSSVYLDPLPDTTNAADLQITGTASPNVQINVQMSKDSATVVSIGDTTSDNNGKFSLLVANSFISQDGTYVFTAISKDSNGITSPPSAPMQTVIDRTPPAPVNNLSSTLTQYNEVYLTWKPPTGNDTDHYLIDRLGPLHGDGNAGKIGSTERNHFTDSNLQNGSAYCYDVLSVDKAGNQSTKQYLCTGTLFPGKIANLYTQMFEAFGEIKMDAISADGSTVVYVNSQSYNAETTDIYIREIGQSKVTLVSKTLDGSPQDGSSIDPAISKDGQTVVFSSDASNLIAGDNNGVADIFIYDRGSDKLTRITDGKQASKNPAISYDGNKIVYLSGGQIYLYDRTTKKAALVSHAQDGTEGNGQSSDPVISGDGSTVAFISQATNLTSKSVNASKKTLYLYDTASDQITLNTSQPSHNQLDKLSINQNGQYIAYIRDHATDSLHLNSQGYLYVYDRKNDKEIPLFYQNMNQSNEYISTSISADGMRVLADYSGQAISKYLVMRDFASQLIDWNPQKPTVTEVGSLGIDTLFSAMDGTAEKFIFQETNNYSDSNNSPINALYYSCTNVNCAKPIINKIDSASWQVNEANKIGGEIKLGSKIKIDASGSSDLSLDALVTYEDSSGNSKQANPIEMKQTIPGRYEGTFTVTNGMAKIDSINVELADHSESKSVSGPPLKVAGEIKVNVQQNPNYKLDGAELIFASQSKGINQVVSVTPSVYSYSVPMSGTTDASVKLKMNNFVLAENDNLTVKNGLPTTIDIPSKYAAALNVYVNGYWAGGSLPHVLFKDKDTGNLIADVAIDKYNNASLPAGHTAGESIIVSVSNLPHGYSPPDPKSVVLKPGVNKIELLPWKQKDLLSSVSQQFHYNISNGAFDNSMQITAIGSQNRSLQADVFYLQRDQKGAQQENHKLINLVEMMKYADHYQGSFALHEGISKIEFYQILIDGNRIDQKFTVNKDVLGRLSLTVSDPITSGPEPTGNTYFFLRSNSSQHNYYPMFYPLKQQGFGTNLFNIPTGTYSLNYYNNGALLAKKDNVLVEAGNISKVSVNPLFMQESLHIQTVDEKGNPIPDLKYQIDEGNGRKYNGRSDAQGNIIINRLWMGSTIHIIFSDSKATYFVKKETITLSDSSLITTHKAILKRHPKTTLTGKVTNENGDPVRFGGITVSEQTNGESVNFQTQMDSNGYYSIDIPAGSFSVSAYQNSSSFSPIVQSSVQAGKLKRLNLTVHDQTAYLNLNIYTKYPGGKWQGPMDLDWRVAYHMRISSNHTIREWGNPLKIIARPHSTVQVCLNPFEANLPQTCKNVQMNANRHGSIDFHLEQTGGSVTGEVSGANNGFITQLFRLNSQGKYIFIRSVYQNLQNFNINITQSGKYRMQISDAKTGQSGATRDFQLSTGQLVNLGQIKLQPFGNFAGRPGNGIQVTPGTVSPGGTIETTTSYSDHGSLVTGSSMELMLPEGASLEDNSVTVDSKPATYKVQNGILTVNIGKGGKINHGDSGIVDFRLHVQDQPFSGVQKITAKIRYTDQNGSEEEMLGTAGYNMIRVNIVAPLVSPSLSVPLSGRAPAGSTVNIYDGNTLLGQIDASAQGYWKLDATLPDNGKDIYHYLRAEADSTAGKLVSEEAVVRYDQSMVQMTSVTMRQKDGRVVTFDPRKGVTRFPYVYIGGGFLYSIQFSDPSRVEHVRVYMGDGYAKASNQNGIFKAFVNPKHVGPIWIKYDVKPDVHHPAPPPVDMQTLKNYLPSNFHFSIGKVTQPSADNGHTGKVSFTLSPKLGLQEDMSVSFKTDPNYVPDAKSAQAAQSSGLPVYGLQVSSSISGNKMIVKFSAHIPKIALQNGGTSTGLRLIMQALATRHNTQPENKQQHSVKILGVGSFVEEFGEATISIGGKGITGAKLWSIFSNWQDLKGFISGIQDPTFSKLSHLMDEADKICDPKLRKMYHDAILALGKKAMTYKAIEWGLNVAGVVLAPETFGLGTLALWGASWFINHEMDKEIGDQMSDINDEIQKLLHDPDLCFNPTLPPPGPPNADPVFIHDPSGYVYEGLPDNRLSGVTATALEQDQSTHSWNVWDASWFGQTNPVTTGSNGSYAWFVPDGQWKVSYEKSGYVTSESNPMTVPPARYGINVGLVSYEPPQIASVLAAPGGKTVDITFTKPVMINSVQSGEITVTSDVYGSQPEAGTFTGVNPGTTDGGSSAAMTIRFTPSSPLQIDGKYTVDVTTAVKDYAGVPLSANDKINIQIIDTDTTPPNEATNKSAVPADQDIVVTWTDPTSPDFKNMRLYWKKTGSSSYGSRMDIAKGVKWADASGLQSNQSYDLKLTAVDLYGNESAGITFKVTTTGAVTIASTPVTSHKQASNEKAFFLNDNGGTITLFENKLELNYGPGSFGNNTLLKLRKDNFSVILPQGYTSYSEMYTLQNGNAAGNGAASNKFSKPVTLSIAYDSANLGNMDQRRLGLYRRSDTDQNHWIYVGGVWDQANHTINAQINQYGEYAVLLYDASLNDLTGHWSESDVNVLLSRHILHGANAKEFQPNRRMTRAEIATMLVNYLEKDNNLTNEKIENSGFKDVPNTVWYAPYVKEANKIGLINGSNGQFRPNDPVTREEMVAMFMRAFKINTAGANTTALAGYMDAAAVSNWARLYMALAVKKEYIHGTAADRLDPLGDASRAEAAVVLLRMMASFGQIFK